MTVDGETYPLPSPFFVVATQNPIELEGTFPLPEAQLDRFLLKIKLGYPDREEEIRILDRFRENDPLKALGSVIEPVTFVELQQAGKQVLVSGPAAAYVADIVRATRDHAALQYGASPRASQCLVLGGKARAVLLGRYHVDFEDIRAVAATYDSTIRFALPSNDRKICLKPSFPRYDRLNPTGS